MPRNRRQEAEARAKAHPARFALLVFAAVNLLFTALLQLPFATASGHRAPFADSLFTAVSATCVTGLTVTDTGAYWSTFGHVVIAAAMSIGGLGIVTIATLLGMAVSRQVGLQSRLMVATDTKIERLADVATLLRVVIFTTVTIELALVVFLFPRFLRAGEEWTTALGHATFYAISAYNNGGFVIHPGGLPTYPGDWWLCTPIIVGVFLGSIGFPALMAIASNLRRPSKWGLHAQLTITTTVILLVGSVFILGTFEWTNAETLGPMNVGQKVLATLFLAVMPRSGGFATVPTEQLDHASLLATDALMFVGGGPVSTAGGIRVTTLAIMFLAVVAEARGDDDVEAFGRRIPTSSLRLAVSVTLVGATFVLVSSMILVSITRAPLDMVLFEVLSAFATCGLSTGLSANLPDLGKYVLTLLMFIGRTGTMTFAAALALRERRKLYRLPEERPIVG